MNLANFPHRELILAELEFMHGSENPVEEGVSGLAVPVKRAKKKNKVAGGVMEMNGVAERGRTGDLV